MSKLLAWVVDCGDPSDGCLLVFAHNRNEAKKTGGRKGPYEWDEYIYIRARRAPSHDAYSTGADPYVIETNEGLPDGAAPFYQETP